MGQRRIAVLFTMLMLTGAFTLSAESPLRGCNLSKHISGPEVTAESVTGKVMLVEYTGYY